MKRLLTVILIVFALVPDSHLYACTGFCISKGDLVLVGNNEDWKNPNTKVWYVSAEEGKYGRVYFGFDNFYPQGGMNEKGLVFDGFATSPNKVKKSLKKTIITVTRTSEKLFAQVEGQEISELIGASDDEFMHIDPHQTVKVTFVKDTGGNIAKMRIGVEGQTYFARRLRTMHEVNY